MKKTYILILTMVLVLSTAYSAPRAKIYPGVVTPETLLHNPSVFGQDSTVATGSNVVAKGIWVYTRVINFGDNTSITNATWSFVSKPSGSTATIVPITSANFNNWAKFKADLTGTYNVKVSITTSAGTHDTTMNIVAGTYVGSGGFDGIAPVYPQCNTCHAGINPTIVNNWKTSGHANIFRFEIDSGASHYSTSCMKCHTVGYDHNGFADNGGFDDKARQLGWNWTNFAPPKPGNWAALKNNFSGLVPFAQIGCENCHGAGSEHATGSSDTTKIDDGIQSGKCGQCHDEPWRHNKYAQWENSNHSEVIWSTSFAQGLSSATNTLDNCIRCHDGRGYINFTKGITTNTVGMTSAKLENVGCATCHDPHGNSHGKDLRSSNASTQKLANGYSYATLGGDGKICMDCHKTRRDAMVYTQTKVTSSHWGPHHNGQTDVLIGQNAATFNGVPYLTGSHKNISNACVTCHMATTTDTGTVTRDKVGGHSMTLHYEATNYDHVKGCLSCHPGITSFEDFDAAADFDGDGTTESWMHEVEGLEHALAYYLPPSNSDSVSWQMIGADTLNPNHLNVKRAYYNWQVIEGDKSKGMHNPFFTVQVLQQSILALGFPIGIEIQTGEVPKTFSLSQNYPNPFNPSTQFKFSLPQNMDVTVKIFDIAGREVKTLVNGKMTAGTYNVTWDGKNNTNQQLASGVYFYRMIAGNFAETKKMILVK